MRSNVSVKNCEYVVRAVIEKITPNAVDRLPSESLCSNLMAEAGIDSQIQVAKSMSENGHNTLHIDGTPYIITMCYFKNIIISAIIRLGLHPI